MTGKTNTISLCMIVKDEAEFIEDCLHSVSPCVQEIVLIDTGSSDETKMIAARYGAQIYPFAWKDNFSEARNFSLEKAHHPWILVMDADEKLSISDAKALPALVADSPPLAYSFIQRNYLSHSGVITWNRSWKSSPKDCEEAQDYAGYLDVAVVRLFPRHSQIRFRGCVHESVEQDIADLGLDLRCSGLTLHHYGQVRGEERLKTKKNLYLELGRKKLATEPSSARAHFEMGVQLQELHRFSEAVGYYSTARDLDSTFKIAELFLGVCYSRLQQYDRARTCLEHARGTLPNSPELECELGIVALKTGDLESAEQHFCRALSYQPLHVASLSYLGAVKVTGGNIDTGMELLRKALSIDPRHRDTLVNLAQASQHLRQYEQACEYLERAGAMMSQDPHILRMLGACLLMAGHHERANSVLQSAVHQWPEDRILRSYWAASLAASGEKTLAIDVYQTLLPEGGRLGQLARQQIQKIGSSVPIENTNMKVTV